MPSLSIEFLTRSPIGHAHVGVLDQGPNARRSLAQNDDALAEKDGFFDVVSDNQLS